jgi:hypothetical protein
MARRTVVVVGLVAVVGSIGCRQRDVPERAPVTDRAPPAPAYRCASADDCALSSHRSATDCCGDPCDTGEPYHEDELAALDAALAGACAPGTFDCPAADCDLPRNYYPGCVDATCVHVELPRPSACERDADCTLSCFRPGACCATCACDAAWHVDDLARADRWRGEHCAAARCPDKKCAMPATTARCDRGRCVAR